jgi:acetoin utilization deacetylase AcuC-like enzyme
MISAGFDSRIGDPLGNFTLEDDDFVELTEIVRELADTTAQGRIISVLEGGYNLEGLAAAVEAHLGALR